MTDQDANHDRHQYSRRKCLQQAALWTAALGLAGCGAQGGVTRVSATAATTSSVLLSTQAVAAAPSPTAAVTTAQTTSVVARSTQTSVSAATSTTAAAASATAASGKVRIMGTFVDETQGAKLWAQWTQEIAAKEPGVQAEFIVQPKADVGDKLLAQIAADDAPDIIQGTVIEYAARGLLVDLTTRIAQDRILETRSYFKKPVVAAQFNGKFWSMPGGLSAYVFWANLDMLRAVGIEPPKDGKMTFDDFVRFTKATTKAAGGGTVAQWGYAADNWFSRMPPLIWANGGDMFDYNTAYNLLTKPTWDMAPTWEAIQWQADLVTKYRVSPSPADTAALKASTFVGGKMLFNYGGGWLISTYRQQIGDKFHWAALRAPTKRAGDPPMEMTPAFLRGSILKGTKVPDAAWRALRYISGPEGNVGYRTYVTDELIFDTPQEIQRYVSQSPSANTQLLVDAAREAGERPFYKTEVRALYGWASDMVPAMNNAFQPIYLGQASAKDAVDKLQPQLQNIIAKGRAAGYDPDQPNIQLAQLT